MLLRGVDMKTVSMSDCRIMRSPCRPMSRESVGELKRVKNTASYVTRRIGGSGIIVVGA